MTRVNLIDVRELSDQHLVAEYRELPRCIKQSINTLDAPVVYCLGKGHVKWAKKHSVFLLKRYKDICEEMTYRGFKVNYPHEDLVEYCKNNCKKDDFNDYVPTEEDIKISRKRIIEKINQNLTWYKWTNRLKD
jgi:deoxyribonuclease (pyrimidine dimer)